MDSKCCVPSVSIFKQIQCTVHQNVFVLGTPFTPHKLLELELNHWYGFATQCGFHCTPWVFSLKVTVCNRPHLHLSSLCQVAQKASYCPQDYLKYSGKDRKQPCFQKNGQVFRKSNRYLDSPGINKSIFHCLASSNSSYSTILLILYYINTHATYNPPFCSNKGLTFKRQLSKFPTVVNLSLSTSSKRQFL